MPQSNNNSRNEDTTLVRKTPHPSFSDPPRSLQHQQTTVSREE